MRVPAPGKTIIYSILYINILNYQLVQ